MALQSLRECWIPDPWFYSIWTTDMTLDSAGDRAAMVVQIPKGGTISKVAFRTGAIVSAQTLRVGIYTLDASGNPTTTLYGSSNYGTLASPTASRAYVVTLGTAATATQADFVAVVVEFDSTAGNVGVAKQTQYNNSNFPYTDFYDGATWTKDRNCPIVGFEYNDGSYAPCGALIYDAVTTPTYFNSGSDPDEYALRFQLPFPSTVVGGWYCGRAGFNGDYEFILYNGTTAERTLTVEGNLAAVTDTPYIFQFRFASSYNVAKDTAYRLAIRPTTTTDVGLVRLDCNVNLPDASLGAYGGGVAFYESRRVNQGTWTDYVDFRPVIGLLLSAFDDAVGGSGGLLVHPGMSGGMRG